MPTRIVGQEVTEDVTDLCQYEVVSMVASNPDHFGLQIDGKKYFGKFSQHVEWTAEVKAHAVLDPFNHPHVIKLHAKHEIKVATLGGITITPLYEPFDWDRLCPHVKEVTKQLLEVTPIVREYS